MENRPLLLQRPDCGERVVRGTGGGSVRLMCRFHQWFQMLGFSYYSDPQVPTTSKRIAADDREQPGRIAMMLNRQRREISMQN